MPKCPAKRRSGSRYSSAPAKIAAPSVASSNRREVDLRFTEPRFLGRNLAAGVEVFDVEIDLKMEIGMEIE